MMHSQVQPRRWSDVDTWWHCKDGPECRALVAAHDRNEELERALENEVSNRYCVPARVIWIERKRRGDVPRGLRTEYDFALLRTTQQARAELDAEKAARLEGDNETA